MRPFVKHTGLVAPLDRHDIDTDQIIPRQFLKRIDRTGYGDFLFWGWRQSPEFVLNDPAFSEASILVTGRNFGCGSSREHAAWALDGFGFRVVIAPSFADIFRANADENGLLAIEVAQEHCSSMISRAESEAGYRVAVDLGARRLTDDYGLDLELTIEDHRRDRLLAGLDRIEATLLHEDAIKSYEVRRRVYDSPEELS